MAKRRKSATKRGKKQSSGINLRIFIIVLVLIALVAFVITYLVTDSNEKEARKMVEASNNESPGPKPVEKTNDTVPMPKITFNGEQVQKGNLDGTWVSNNDGAMLTINGRNYSMELPNVDGTIVDKGTIVVLTDKVKFVDTDEESPCTVSVGVYSYKVVKGVISFQKIDDKCDSRIERLSATWYKI